MGEKKEYPYNETKKCRLCGKKFSAQSVYGNPYKWCPSCRAEKYDDFGKKYGVAFKM